MKLQCSRCARTVCFKGKEEEGPEFCPRKGERELLNEAREKVKREPLLREMFRAVALTWKDTKLSMTRIEEIIAYARRRGFRHLGLAFCVGLTEEAGVLTNILENNGFEVEAVSCMCGGLPPEEIGIKEEEKVYPQQLQCNPVAQAMLLNKRKTELNLILGLCVGDDTAFIAHSQAPVTVVAVKDRVLAHNPLGAIYTAKRFYARLRPKKN